jgi:hypothetical protein
MQKLLKLSEQYRLWLLTAILIVVPLFPKFPAFRILGTYVAIRLEDFLILATALVFSIPILINLKSLIKENITKSIILFVIIGGISIFSGFYLTQTISLKIGLLHWIRRIEYMSLFFVGYTYLISDKSKGFAEYIIKLLLLVNFLVFLYGFGQHYLNFPVIVTQNEEYSKGIALRWVPGAHINSTFAGHYDLASYLVLIIPIFVSAFFVVKDKISKMFFALSTGIGFWLFSVAVSRISIVAFLVATTASLFLLKKYKEIIIVVVISAIAFGFSPDLRTRYGRIIDVVKQKISSVVVVYAQEDGNVNEDRSTSIRLNVEWPRAIRAFLKNPIVGTGYSSITLATDNDYLRALGETGVLGLASFILILINIYLGLSKYKFSDNFESVLVASFIGSSIGIVFTALFLDIFEASKFAISYWLFAGIVYGLSKISSSKSEII